MRRQVFGLVGLITLTAFGTLAPACHRHDPPVGLDGMGLTNGPLTFPPPDSDWLDRTPLTGTTEAGRQNEAITVASPQLDDKKHFEFDGRVLRISFNQSVFDGQSLKTAPRLEITPKVKGKTVWESGWAVEFRADKPFDPDTEYKVDLPEFVGRNEKKFVGGFHATFTATPNVVVAGKTIHYVPRPGQARVVALSPREGDLGGPQEIVVLYDQPIDLGVASRIVTLRKGKESQIVKASLRHPETPVYDGEKVDPRFVVLAAPASKLAPGESLSVEAASQVKDQDEAKTASYAIAALPKLESIKCRSEKNCEAKDGLVRGPNTGGVEITWNNHIRVADSDAKKYVHITPEPKNLRAYDSWSGLSLSGSFESSKTYAIRVAGLKDIYGAPIAPLSLTYETLPLAASATLSEAVLVLDEAAVKSFPVTTRNVEQAALELWPIAKGDAAAYAKALAQVRVPGAPEGEPFTVPFSPVGVRDSFVDTTIDLDKKLERGRAYLARVKALKTVALAPAAGSDFPSGSEASHPATAILYAAGPNALGTHVHRVGDRAVAQVFRLASGEPVADAKVTIGTVNATTNAQGAALLTLPADPPEGEPIVAVAAKDAELMMPLVRSSMTASSSLFPDLGRADEPARDAVGMVVTDRGIYRPGSKMFVKAFLRRVQNARIAAAANEKVHLHVIDPMNEDVLDEELTTNARGVVMKDIELDAGHTGRFRVQLELGNEARTVLAEETVRVAEFETPKFKVDVETKDRGKPAEIDAKISGRYLFGAPMSGGKVSWVITKKLAPVRAGKLGEAGLAFARETSYWDDRNEGNALKPVTGEGVLGRDGTFALHAALGPLAAGPTEAVIEADVSDDSNRHIAGTARVLKDPYAKHAGLKVARRFGMAGQPVHVDLGVVDAAGNAVSDVPVSARLERVVYGRIAEKAQSGAVIERWGTKATSEGSCDVTSGKGPVGCDLTVPRNGEYRMVAVIDGRDDASVHFWAYGGEEDRTAAPAGVPSQGKKIPLVLDKAKYEGGETAKVFVQSPFKKATALLTIEQGGLLSHEVKQVDGSSTVFDVPVSAANVPWTHAAVTLLPIGEDEADYRVGVVRIPVSAKDARLQVAVSSAKKRYEPRDEAEIVVDVKRADGTPAKNADVTLAVVDEGILRMTAFHAKDPAVALRPGRGLDFRAFDSRSALLRRRERAHAAGDGEGAAADEVDVDTRKNFVETAAWLPDLVTDEHGRVTAKVTLPDNVTEFRMMAVVVDEAGAGGNDESSFTVAKPLLLEPSMPAFALRGDTFEAAAMVHNTTDAPVPAKVTVADQTREVVLPARGHQRVAVPMSADAIGTRTMAFALEAAGKLQDKVEMPLRIDEPGIDEHPRISGAFRDRQVIDLAVPQDAIFAADEAVVSIKTGSALYPELGQRLSYLLEYPHGCVEQTTSSTLPLMAARTILPWAGVAKMEDAELTKRIKAGVERLATMRTASGGLAYWPGGTEPHVYGTAYAMDALLRAKEMGIEHPKLIESVTKYLAEQLPKEESAELKVSIAEVLARAKALPEGSMDSLYDTRNNLAPFGLAHLGLALASQPKQEDRVKEVLDRLEASFDDQVESKTTHGENDWSYWGSGDRDRAGALIALTKLRPKSKLVPLLAVRLARKVERWSTQDTAWSLLGLADYIGQRTPNGGVDVRVELDGRKLEAFRSLGGDNKEVRIPLKDLAGKHASLVLVGSKKTATAFTLEARYKRPLGAVGTRVARRGRNGVSLHRVFSDSAGNPIDIEHVKAGQVVRVAVRAELPEAERWQRSYVAITDRLPAGLSPINPDLATTGSVPNLAPQHPFYSGLHDGSPASHVELRDDRVQLYFDTAWDGTLYATYLARATTPGKYTLPPASGEMMYEPDSDGWSEAGRVIVE